MMRGGFGDGVEAAAQPADPAMRVAREVTAEGGDDVHIGAIRSSVAGRTDHHPMVVPSGCYVIPADIVSSLGEGNTESGFAVLEHMFPASASLEKAGTAGGNGDRRAEGGMVSDTGQPVDIMAAGGEFVIAPADIEKQWGSLQDGHAVLDHFVKTQRKTLIKTLKGLPGPAQD